MEEAITCDNCERPAVANYMDVIVRFDVLPDGSYGKQTISDDFGAGEAVNRHLCQEHEEQYIAGNID